MPGIPLLEQVLDQQSRVGGLPDSLGASAGTFGLRLASLQSWGSRNRVWGKILFVGSIRDRRNSTRYNVEVCKPDGM